MSFQETKRPLPWPLRRILPQMVLGYPSSRLCEAPPALFRCGEMKVWELLLFVPGTCAGAATWAEGRLGDAVAQVSSLVGNRNDKWLPLGTPPAFLQDRLSLAAAGLHTDRVGTRLSEHRPPLRSPPVSSPSPHSSPALDEAACPTANLKVSKC